MLKREKCKKKSVLLRQRGVRPARGDDVYERDIRLRVASGNKGKFVAIDIETGEWELDASALAASEQLIARVPDSQTHSSAWHY